MQTWTNSQPTPRVLLWPLRSPVMRWPVRLNLPSFLDIDVDQLAGMFASVAAHRLGRLQGFELVQPEARQDAANGGRRDRHRDGDLPAGPALAPERLDPFDDGRRGRSMQAVRAGTAIEETGTALGAIAGHPFSHGARTDADGIGHSPKARLVVTMIEVCS